MTSDRETPQRVVVDGSNLATEGRSLPSLAQLDEAVRAFREEHVDDDIIVVVDASFSYRIDESERQILEDAEAAGEIVSPPAGAIGRGDGFLLRIADRTGAVVLSNDSFQEFHGEYKWLFEEGRLIGGKPVPGVGWIFTPRTPVRGPKSRVAVRDAERARRRTTKKVEEPVAEAIAEATAEAIEPDAPGRTKRGRRRGPATSSPDAVNEPLPFITFIANHRLGSEVEGEVDSFTSHGAFVNAGGARCYAPVVGLGDPPPRSAKEVLTRGETLTFVVQALDPPRRGIELALPGLARPAGKPTQETVEAEIDEIEIAPPATRIRRRLTPAPTPDTDDGAAAASDGSVGDSGEPEKPAARTRKRAPARKRAGSDAAAEGDDAAPVVATPAGDGAPGDDLLVPAKRARRSTSKRSPAEAPDGAPDGAEVVGADGSPPGVKGTRRGKGRKKAPEAPEAPAAEGTGSSAAAEGTGSSEAQAAQEPTMKRPSTRTATRRSAGPQAADTATAAAEASATEATGVGAATSMSKRTRRAVAPEAPVAAPVPAEAAPASPETSPTRSGPRRSTIKKAATTTDPPGRSRAQADAASPVRAAGPRRAAKATSPPPATADEGDAESVSAPPKPAAAAASPTTSKAPPAPATAADAPAKPTKIAKSPKTAKAPKTAKVVAKATKAKAAKTAKATAKVPSATATKAAKTAKAPSATATKAPGATATKARAKATKSAKTAKAT